MLRLLRLLRLLCLLRLLLLITADYVPWGRRTTADYLLLLTTYLGATVLGHADIVGRDAHHLACIVVQHLVRVRVRVREGQGQAEGEGEGEGEGGGEGVA